MSVGVTSPSHLEALRPGSCRTPAASIGASRSTLSCAPTPNSESRLEAERKSRIGLDSRFRHAPRREFSMLRPITLLHHSPVWLHHVAMLAACLVNRRPAGPSSRDPRETSARSLSSATRPSERCYVASCCVLGHEADRPIVARCGRAGAPSPPPLSAGVAMCKARETTLRRYPHTPVGRDASRFRRRAYTPSP